MIATAVAGAGAIAATIVVASAVTLTAGGGCSQ